MGTRKETNIVSKLVNNERWKLTANLLNSLATAFIVTGFVAPVLSQRSLAGYSIFSLFVGGTLHWLGRKVLGGLKE